MTASSSTPAVTGPACYLNRELAWIEFNRRVLEEAEDPRNPLLERVRFLAITSSNLDEFFEVRVAGLRRQVEAGVKETSPDGLTPERQLEAVHAECRKFVADQYRVWTTLLRPALAEAGIRLLYGADLSPDQRAWVSKYFDDVASAVLTPLAIDPAHPFPQLLTKSLNLAVALRSSGKRGVSPRFAIVQIPRVLPRLVLLPQAGSTRDYILQKELIRINLERLFPGFQVVGGYPFRLTRNSDIDVAEDEASDLLQAIELKLRRRRRAEAVRLEVSATMPADLAERLVQKFGLTRQDLYVTGSPVNLGRLMELVDLEDRQDLKWPAYVPSSPVAFVDSASTFDRLKSSDVLLHHPFDSFDPLVEFLEVAAEDPAVLAIKMTLYRTGADSPVVRALMAAAEMGKQVTVLVELKARFDEENNIRWARALEQQGVHVVYGIPGLKTHCKIVLVVRRENDGVQRYCHLGTGNYNPNTARVYTDLGLFTAEPDIGRDVADLFNYLTSYAQPGAMRKLLVAPFSLHAGVVDRIRRETEHAKAGRPARILAKMNALVDKDVIDALYAASCAGVKIDLIVRGICCLRPGMAGLSENVHVRSIVGRFLEHSRVFAFENGGDREVWLGSADWMPRNFFGRVEVVFPLLTAALRARVLDEILAAYLHDEAQARVLQPDGSWVRLRPPKEAAPGDPAAVGLSAQGELLRIARGRAAERPAGAAAPRSKPRRAPRASEFLRERGL